MEQSVEDLLGKLRSTTSSCLEMLTEEYNRKLDTIKALGTKLNEVANLIEEGKKYGFTFPVKYCWSKDAPNEVLYYCGSHFWKIKFRDYFFSDENELFIDTNFNVFYSEYGKAYSNNGAVGDDVFGLQGHFLQSINILEKLNVGLNKIISEINFIHSQIKIDAEQELSSKS